MSLYITGKTFNDKFLLGGFYTLKDTHGIPIDYSYELYKDNDEYLIDWAEYLLDCGQQSQYKFDNCIIELSHLLTNYSEIYNNFIKYFIYLKHISKLENFDEICKFGLDFKKLLKKRHLKFK